LPRVFLIIDFLGLTFVFPLRLKIRAEYSEQGIQLQHFEKGVLVNDPHALIEIAIPEGKRYEEKK
jgi:hypothetical protein